MGVGGYLQEYTCEQAVKSDFSMDKASNLGVEF